MFAELLLGKSEAIFPGELIFTANINAINVAQNTPSQFDMICSKCGVPDEESWPGFKSFGNYANMIPKKNYPRTLMSYMRKKKPK